MRAFPPIPDPLDAYAAQFDDLFRRLMDEVELTSATGGRGSYHMEFSHYEEVPSHLHGKIISAAKAERGEAEAAEA
jgi:hypothetical protein